MSDALSDGLPRPSPERLAADLRALEAFTRPDRPYTRRAFSDEDRAARKWLAGRMAEAGLVPVVDAAGNQIGRRPGGEPGPPLMIGSHLDTVEAGGRFDGIAGVLAGLEVARCLDAGGHRLAHPLEVDQLHLRGAVRLRAVDDRQPRDERQARRRHRAPSPDRRAGLSPPRSTRWAAGRRCSTPPAARPAASPGTWSSTSSSLCRSIAPASRWAW